ncbi:MAG: ACP S-malonyltransferase [Candidatus Promineifilaceae bacterium]|nr:ACP S-malonyltransferase [Candidatus Promineifilaceae bacterium]
MSSVVLFPGQGSQVVGMGLDAYERSPAAKAIFDDADSLLGFSISSLCFHGPEDELTDTINQQPALFTTSVAYWHAMLEKGWQVPEFMAGHSLGEFSALVAAGSISFADGLHLVRKRGELMKKADTIAPGGMAALLAVDIETGNEICSSSSETTGFPVQVANDNCPGQIVISGNEAALQEAMILAKEKGARKVVRLPISIAAHSVLMTPIAEIFAEAIDNSVIQTPQVPVVGNVSASLLRTVDDVKDELKHQLTSSVAWTGSIRYLLDQGVDTFVETGPGQVLLGLVKRINRQTKRIGFEV